MDFENLIKLMVNDPENLHIFYELKDGKERLVVNGEEIKAKEEFDDSGILNEIQIYKKNIELLDDCVFVEVMEEISENIDIKTFDTLINQKHFTETEAEHIIECLDYINNVIKDRLCMKIDSFVRLLDRF